jgi:SNW domain-containing protein 1
VPVLHSPPRKLTVKDMANWKIPPCVSNWKNAKGYTIPLDKRLAADGRALQEHVVNDNFAKVSEALYIAERKAREEIELRDRIRRQMLLKEKESKEDELRQLAMAARHERAVATQALAPEELEAVRGREEMRDERRKCVAVSCLCLCVCVCVGVCRRGG